MEHWRFSGDEVKGKDCALRAQKELGIHRDLVRLGNLDQYKTKRVFGDGLTVECQTVFNDEIIKVYYTPPEGEKVYVEELSHPTPILEMVPQSEDDHKIVVFPACAALSYRGPYPPIEQGGIYIPESYEPYRLTFNSETRTVISSLRPIHSKISNFCVAKCKYDIISTSNPDISYYDRYFIFEDADENELFRVSEIPKERFKPVGAEESFDGTYIEVAGSAIIHDAEGYDDYSAWIIVYVRAFPNNLAEIIVVTKDSVNGFVEHRLSDVIYFQTVGELEGFFGISAKAYCGIYDYYGTPYFVGSFFNYEGEFIG